MKYSRRQLLAELRRRRRGEPRRLLPEVGGNALRLMLNPPRPRRKLILDTWR